MTSFAFILGVFPLVVATGAGAEMRRALGAAVFAGMFGVTFFGIFLTPVFYYVVGWLGGSGKAQATPAQPSPPRMTDPPSPGEERQEHPGGRGIASATV